MKLTSPIFLKLDTVEHVEKHLIYPTPHFYKKKKLFLTLLLLPKVYCFVLAFPFCFHDNNKNRKKKVSNYWNYHEYHH